MGTAIARDPSSGGPVGRWCCGQTRDEWDAVRLGGHQSPVVGPVLRWLGARLP